MWSIRNSIFLIAPLVAIVLLVGSFLMASAGLLPDPVAIHWSVSGQADQFLDLNSYLWLVTLGFSAYWSGLVALEVLPSKAKLLRPLLKSLLVGLYFFILLLVAATIILQVLLDTDESLFIGQWIFFIVIPVAIMVWLLSAKPILTIREQLEIKLRNFLFLSVPIQAIESIGVTQLRARHHGGWGLRYAANTLAFIPSSGEAVLIKLGWGERIAVRMDNPNEFVTRYELETAG